MNFSHLSHEQVEAQLKLAVHEENKAKVLVLHLLAEVEKKRLYSKEHPSLYEYCVKVLKYSNGAAQRRIDTMRAMKLIPEIESKLLSGELNLSSVAQAQSFFRHEAKQSKVYSVEEKKELLSKLENKSSRDCIQTLVEISPQSVPDEKRRVVTAEKTQLKVCLDKQVIEKLDRIKALLSHKKSHLTDAELIETLADLALERLDPGLKKVREPKKKDAAKKLSTSGATNKKSLPTSVAVGRQSPPTSEAARHKTIPQPTTENPLLTSDNLLSTSKSPLPATEDLRPDAECGDELLGSTEKNQLRASVESKSPNEGEQVRATDSKQPVESAETQPRPISVAANKNSLPASVAALLDQQQKAYRYIPTLLKKQVWLRDQGRCTHKGCGSRYFLQVDHIQAIALGGKTELSNLRLLCRTHNIQAAIEVFGTEYMKKYVEMYGPSHSRL